MSNNNKSNNQYILHDAIHGTIDLRFGLKQVDYEKLYEILNCSFLNRLRSIKQLGFASHSHPSADHSRHAHAIGTMHIMNSLFSRIVESDEFKAISADVEKCFEIKGETEIRKHLLLAGLLQDIGELPFAQATQGIIKPNENTIKKVYRDIGDGKRELDDKNIFTIGAIFHSDVKEHLEGLGISFSFLVFLITGHEAKGATEADESRALLHMVDGDVDADRLDYVFRDGHHTYGYGGNPNHVISSLIGYDKDGPIFNDPGPISEYFLKRGHLWTSVYLIPENRFKNNLLKSFLIEYFKTHTINQHLKQEISLEEFADFHDISLFYELNKIKFDRSFMTAFSDKGKMAINTLLQPKEKYEWFWLPPIKASTNIANAELPDDVFYDTFANYNRHNLFTTKHIRISSPQYEKLGDTVYLEECSGAFNKTAWFTLPRENCFLVFKPVKNGSGQAWQNFLKAEKDKSLYELIVYNENSLPQSLPFDTWEDTKFTGKKIFISYATTDLAMVNKIVHCLHKASRKYRIIRDPDNNQGSTFYDDSIAGITDSEAILMIASTNYYSKYQTTSYVRDEVNKMIAEHYQPIPLGIDDFEKVKDLPWKDLGYINDTPVAIDLKSADLTKIETSVSAVLRKIDTVEKIRN